MVKIGFIGAGNMAQAMIEGWLKAGVLAPSDIVIHGGTPAHDEAVVAKFGVTRVQDNSAVVTSADLVILAVKPKLAGTVLPEIAAIASAEKKPLVSLMTGVSLADMSALLGDSQVPIVRTMPNVNVAINAGMTAYAVNEAAQAHETQVVALLDALGQSMPLAEADFSTFVALAGSSPAFVYLFIDALSRAGVKYGLTKDAATRIAAQAVAGSAKMVLASDRSPFDLIDTVSSPGGTTVAGLLAMEAAGFMPSVVAGVDATIAKDQAAH